MDKLNTAVKLREEGQLNESNRLLLELVKEQPDNAELNYQCAWSFDVLGRERDAMPYYERAIEMGLPEEDLKGAYLGLGSTLRTIGEYAKYKGVLKKGLNYFRKTTQ